MKPQAKTIKSTRQLRQLDQNSSFKSKLRLDKGKLGEIFKKPQYDRQLIAPEKSIAKFPLKKILTENLKNPLKNPNSLLLTSTPHHTLGGSKANFFNDRRSSTSISPIQQQKPCKAIENGQKENSLSEASDDDSEVHLDIKKAEQIKPNRWIGTTSNRIDTNGTPVANKEPVVAKEKKAAEDSLIFVDSDSKKNDSHQQGQEKTPNNLRLSRRDQHNSTTNEKKKRSKSDSTVSVTKKSKIPLRTISHDKEVDANGENKKKDVNINFTEAVRYTPSMSGQKQMVNCDLVTPKNVSMMDAPDSSCLRENKLSNKKKESPVRTRDMFVNKTPRSNRKVNYEPDENGEILTRTINLADKTDNIKANELTIVANHTVQTSILNDLPKTKTPKNNILEIPSKLVREANLEPRQTNNKDVQTTFFNIDAGTSPERHELYEFTEPAELGRKRKFEIFLKGLEEFALEADKVSTAPTIEEIGKKRPRKKSSSESGSDGKILHNIVSKLAKRAQEASTPEKQCKTPKNNQLASKKNPLFRRSHRKASQKELREPAVISLGEDSRESYQNDSERRNIFDSLEVGNVVDVVDFSNDAVPEISVAEKPWRFEGSDGPMRFNNITLKFSRKEADIRYSDCYNVSEETLPGKISLESTHNFKKRQNELSKDVVELDNIVPNVESRKSYYKKTYSRNLRSCAAEEDNEQPAANNPDAFKKPPTPKQNTNKTSLRKTSRKSGSAIRKSPANGGKQNNISKEAEKTIFHEESDKENSKTMSSTQIQKKNVSYQARKKLFGVELPELAPDKSVSDESQTPVNSSKSKKQPQSGQNYQTIVIEESRSLVNRELRPRKPNSNPNQDKPVNKAKKNVIVIPLENEISTIVSEPEANNNTNDFPQKSHQNIQLKEGIKKPNCQPELIIPIPITPINLLINRSLKQVSSSKPKEAKKPKQKLPSRNKIPDNSQRSRHAGLTAAVDASNVQDCGTGRPQRTRKPAKRHTDIVQPKHGYISMSLFNSDFRSKPRKRKSNIQTNNNNGTTSTILNNLSEQTTCSIESANLKSLATEISGMEILSHGKNPKRININTLDTIVDEDAVQENELPQTGSRNKRGKKATTTAKKVAARGKSKVSVPIINNENARLNPVDDHVVDEHPMSLESEVIQHSKIPDVSGIERFPNLKEPILSTDPDLGSILEENANDATSFQDVVPTSKTKPKNKVGRPKKTPNTDTISKKLAKEKSNVFEPIANKENARLNEVDDHTDKQPMVCESEVLPMVDNIPQIPDVSGIERLPNFKEPIVPNDLQDSRNTQEKNANNATSLQDDQLFVRPEPPSSRRSARPRKGTKCPEKKPSTGKRSVKKNLELLEEVRVDEENDVQMGSKLRVPEVTTLSQLNGISNQDLEHSVDTTGKSKETKDKLEENLDNKPMSTETIDGEEGQYNNRYTDGFSFNSRLSTFDLTSQIHPRCSLNASEKDYVKCVLDGKPMNLKFVCRLPAESKFKQIRNMYVTASCREPTGLFSFGYLKLNANDEKVPSIGNYAFTFCVIKGTAHVELEGSQSTINVGEGFMIPSGMKYGIKNASVHEELLMSFTRIKNGGT
ncbi:uncharacterized protein LOC126735356 isoform X2 [Anthonomus grandis grandis]|uniref:uncharacterized protein LOC126735356 isoform X2 n=1 Tax=Anthonomus grandis grandis TaxID=2921223 RepID=UPI0021668571|nr:uncharacterized protein LOC126735356 isoform X2 [Anthonomus grandis grandis]